MNSNELRCELIKLHEYGAGSCFGCGGAITSYRENISDRLLDLCGSCGEVVYAPRMLNGMPVNGFERGVVQPDGREEMLF
jgi:hypothetical protein